MRFDTWCASANVATWWQLLESHPALFCRAAGRATGLLAGRALLLLNAPPKRVPQRPDPLLVEALPVH